MWRVAVDSLKNVLLATCDELPDKRGQRNARLAGVYQEIARYSTQGFGAIDEQARRAPHPKVRGDFGGCRKCVVNIPKFSLAFGTLTGDEVPRFDTVVIGMCSARLWWTDER